jgi:hypothetical protein
VVARRAGAGGLIRHPARWPALAARHPSALLLAVQLASLLVYPLVDGRDTRVLFSAFTLVAVPLTVWVVFRSHAANWFAWALAIPAMLLAVGAIAFGAPALAAGSAALESVLYFYAAGALIIYMLEDHTVTVDELFAAAAAFTLLAWAFAYAFLVCQALAPGSFIGAEEPERPRRWLELLFLSFSTLSGTGNGDVMPVLPYARVLVMLEQFAGVGYIAAVVSRLIALSIVRQRGRRGG